MNKPPKFSVEQIALCPKDTALARKLLVDLGLTDWVADSVHASGVVRGVICENHAHLQFNYQGGTTQGKPLELELLHYTNGHNWMTQNPNTVSHLGMHCTDEELEQFRAYFSYNGIGVVQEVKTLAHTNAFIKDTRRYQYAIFDTKDILGVDLKFIVRHYLTETAHLDLPKEVRDASQQCSEAQNDWPIQGAKPKKHK